MWWIGRSRKDHTDHCKEFKEFIGESLKVIIIKCSKCFTAFSVYGKPPRGKKKSLVSFLGNLRSPDRCPKHECKPKGRSNVK